jgi:hypothetical protein
MAPLYKAYVTACLVRWGRRDSRASLTEPHRPRGHVRWSAEVGEIEQSFIASQRTIHQVPHAKCCRFLGVSASWFYKWHDREPTKRERRQEELDCEVSRVFEDSGGIPRTSPGRTSR